MWRYADYIITSMVFVFIGFELTAVLKDNLLEPGDLMLALLVVGTLIVLRFAWIFPAMWLERLRRRRHQGAATPVGNRETVVTSWAGMRGVVTVATALALPVLTDAGDRFPQRHTILFVGLATVLATLVVQGLTLAPMVRWLRVGDDADTTRVAKALRRQAMKAALEAARTYPGDVPDRVRNAVILQYEGDIASHDALHTATHGKDEVEDDRGDQREVVELLRRAAEAERELIIDARLKGRVSPEVADQVLSEIENRAVRDSG